MLSIFVTMGRRSNRRALARAAGQLLLDEESQKESRGEMTTFTGIWRPDPVGPPQVAELRSELKACAHSVHAAMQSTSPDFTGDFRG